MNNLLVTEPSPRNPRLADITKRIGISERTGRGVDRIYEGLLRYGRPPPDYTRSSSASTVLRMRHAEGDQLFIELVLKEEAQLSRPLPLDSLLILSRLKQESHLKITDLALSTQKSEQETKEAVDRLVKSGLVEAKGTGKGRTYMLSAKLYEKAGYVRQVGVDPIQQEQMITKYIATHGTIKRAEVADLCRLGPYQASRILRKMVTDGKIHAVGKGKGTYYELRARS